MPILNLTDAGFARWRIWAADLRDEKGPQSEDAGLLCRILDLHDEFRRRAAAPNSACNLADGLRGCIEQLIGRMLANGAIPPTEAAVLK